MKASVASVLIQVLTTCVLTSAANAANNVTGAWLSPGSDNWPPVALHAILTPDGRVLTYGSRESVQATGFFYYDVWDPAEGLSGGHVTLQNMTLTDIFCSYTDRQARRAVQVDRGFAVGGFSGK